jgi:hypothetical protein
MPAVLPRLMPPLDRDYRVEPTRFIAWLLARPDREACLLDLRDSLRRSGAELTETEFAIVRELCGSRGSAVLRPCQPEPQSRGAAARTQDSCRLDPCAYVNPDLVARIAVEHGVSEAKGARWLAEMLKFLVVTDALMDELGGEYWPKAPPPEVDFAWHAFILDTEAYASFCQRYFGRFIHHRPGPSSHRILIERMVTYTRLRLEVERRYGTTEPDIWPRWRIDCARGRFVSGPVASTAVQDHACRGARGMRQHSARWSSLLTQLRRRQISPTSRGLRE